MKRLMEPDPQMQTGEWLLHSRELQDTEDQFYQKMREPDVERLREVRGEPGKEQTTGGGPPRNGAKSWPKTKKLRGGKPGLRVSTIGGTSPPLGTETPPPLPLHQQ